MAADVQIQLLQSSSAPKAGQSLNYVITVFNAGPDIAQDVLVSDTLPSIFQNPQLIVDSNPPVPWPGSYFIGTVGVNQTVSFQIQGNLDPASIGQTLTNTASVSSSTPDPNLNNNSATKSVLVGGSADISISKTVDVKPSDTVIPGQTINYTLFYQNIGPSNADNVIITDTLPNTLTNATFSVNSGPYSPWTGSYAVGLLGPGASAYIEIQATVALSATGLIDNTATIDSTTTDPNPSDNSSSISIQVTPQADISVVKTASPTPATPGQTLTYTLVVSNAGPSTAQAVNLVDPISAFLTGVQFSTDGGTTFNPWSGTYSVGTLANGASKTILIKGIINPLVAGSITNSATVSSPTQDPDLSNNNSIIITWLTPKADISVVKTANPSPVMPGQTLTYTLVVSNAGPSAAQNVNLIDPISSVLTNVQFSTDGGATFNPWPTFYPIGLIPSGTSKTFLIKGTVDPTATGTIINTADVSGITPDPNPNNNSSTITTDITPIADLSVEKTASPNPVMQGQALSYNIVVNNAGPSTAYDVTLTDIIPSELTNVQFSVNGGSYNPWTGSYNLGSIANGVSVTISITGTLSSTAIGTIKNTATVSNTTKDPDPTNNTSTANVDVAVPAMKATKKVAPKLASPGDTLYYEITLVNTGNVPLSNIVVLDNIPTGTSYIANSLTSNVAVTGIPPTINLTNPMAPGDIATIKFAVTVNNVCTPTCLSNKATVNYRYIVNSGIIGDGSTTTNEVFTSIDNRARLQAKTDLIQSVALEQAALAHILNAEGEKIQKVLAMQPSSDNILKVNKSVNTTVDSISNLEIILQNKLRIANKQACPNNLC